MAPINESNNSSSTGGPSKLADKSETSTVTNIPFKKSPTPNDHQKTKWKTRCKKHSTPSNLLKLFLVILVIVAGAILFMVMVGMMKVNYPETYLEVTSQILNAVFTLAAITSHPVRLKCMILFFKFRRAKRREENDRHKPVPVLENPGILQDKQAISTKLSSSETIALKIRKHFPSCYLQIPQDYTDEEFIDIIPSKKFFCILLLLNLNCFFQYPIAFAMWRWVGVEYPSRPSWIVACFLPLSFLSGTIGSVMLLLHQRKLKKLRKTIKRSSISVQLHDIEKNIQSKYQQKSSSITGRMIKDIAEEDIEDTNVHNSKHDRDLTLLTDYEEIPENIEISRQLSSVQNHSTLLGDLARREDTYRQQLSPSQLPGYFGGSL